MSRNLLLRRRLALSKRRALFLRFARVLRHASRRVAGQLGHRQREAVYQRALAAELEACGYCCELEFQVPVRYVSSDGRVCTVAHERADILVSWDMMLLGDDDDAAAAAPFRSVAVVEVKRGFATKSGVGEATEQARRYGENLMGWSQLHRLDVTGVAVVYFDKRPKCDPQHRSEAWDATCTETARRLPGAAVACGGDASMASRRSCSSSRG